MNLFRGFNLQCLDIEWHGTVWVMNIFFRVNIVFMGVASVLRNNYILEALDMFVRNKKPLNIVVSITTTPQELHVVSNPEQTVCRDYWPFANGSTDGFPSERAVRVVQQWGTHLSSTLLVLHEGHLPAKYFLCNTGTLIDIVIQMHWKHNCQAGIQ